MRGAGRLNLWATAAALQGQEGGAAAKTGMRAAGGETEGPAPLVGGVEAHGGGAVVDAVEVLAQGEEAGGAVAVEHGTGGALCDAGLDGCRVVPQSLAEGPSRGAARGGGGRNGGSMTGGQESQQQKGMRDKG